MSIDELSAENNALKFLSSQAPITNRRELRDKRSRVCSVRWAKVKANNPKMIRAEMGVNNVLRKFNAVYES